MIRDKYKNEEYFSHYLEKKEKLFKMMELAMEQRKKSADFSGENDPGIINAYKGLSLNYMLYTIAQYSAGEDIENIKETYKTTLQYSERVWKENSSYVDCLWLVALGVLLGVSEKEITVLNHIVEKCNKEDKLIGFLMEHMGKEEHKSKDYFMPMPYEILNEYLEGIQRDAELAKMYLANSWYNAHSDMAWYDSHKDKSNTYYGYWSFEVGAIAKILNLDDSSLKDVPYYPYDLVHYKK